jgi:ADP-ribosylglycohydrolase
VLWSLAVRNAVLTGRLDARCGLAFLEPRQQAWWAQQIDAAEVGSPSSFTPNGYTVTAFQAAWASIHATRHLAGAEHVAAALHTAVAIGDDTDTVAAIAGGLLGAAYGASQIPSEWARDVHGWPGLRGDDLQALGEAIARHS